MITRRSRCSALTAAWPAAALGIALLWPPAVTAAPVVERTGGLEDSQALPAPQSRQETPGTRAFAEGLRALERGERDVARERFETARRFAVETANRYLEAGSHRGLALVAAAEGRHEHALREHQIARDLFGTAGDRTYVAFSMQAIGTELYWLGRRDEAREAWQNALLAFTELGNATEQASVLYNLTLASSTATEQREFIGRALPLARRAGDRARECQLLAARSDIAFQQGNYRDAFDDVQSAIAVLPAADPRAARPLAHAYTSLGRLYRAHAQFPHAVAAYERAMALQGPTGDSEGQAQSARAIATAYDGMGRQDLRRTYLERSLQIIRATDAVVERNFSETHMAAYLLDAGDTAGAMRLLDTIVETDWGRGSEWAQSTLARAFVASGRPALAIEPATRAIVLARAANFVERLFWDLQVRADVFMSLARYREAFDDLREALDVVERVRATLVPHDYMKRGFMDVFRSTMGMAIEALHQLDRPGEAMEVAERGRARAFADLLLARQVRLNPEPLPASRAMTSGEAAPAGRASAVADNEIATRGGAAGHAPVAGDDLPSDAAAPPATAAEMIRVAATSEATVLAYWVDRHVTWAWLVSPAGRISSARIDATEKELRDLVQRVWRSRAETPRAAAGPATPDGGRRDGLAPTQALHRLLIAPLRQRLADAGARRLIVIPHGPLLALSFAALQDARGRYLVEDYALSYAPAAWMLTQARIPPSPQRADRYLLVGAPAELPVILRGQALAPLPGARRELAAVAGQVGSAKTLMLAGRDASEARLRAAARRADVLHVATHGVMFDEAPLESFLALDATDASGDPADDGRLTAREVYDLDLRAGVVVLSACRSGLGRLSGDGLFGLARAFFYAGAHTVVATLWDVADEPSTRLTTRFHERLATGSSASEALRDAQLALLRDLRAGRVLAHGRRGRVPLPEHPSLWAGFVLIGQP